MAEVIGLITSIGTIVSGAISFAKLLSTLADDIYSAGGHIKAISIEIKVIAEILHNLKRRINTSTKLTQQSLEVVKEIADLIRDSIEGIKQCLLPVLPLNNSGMTITQKAKWIFVKSKIATKNVALNSSKLTLELFLHTLDFAEGEEIENHTREVIGDMIAETEWTKSKFLKAERIDQMVANAYDACRCSGQETGEHSIEHGATCVVLQLPNKRFHSQDEGSPVLENSITISDNGNTDTAVISLSATTKSPWQREEMSEISILESLSVENFLHIAQHLRTQQTVSSYALIVLDGKQDKDGIVEVDTTLDESLDSNEASTDPNTNTDHENSPFLKRAHKDRADHYNKPSLKLEHERLSEKGKGDWVLTHPGLLVDSIPQVPRLPGRRYPPPGSNPYEDPEMTAIKKELAEIKKEKEKKQAEAKLHELEARIKEEAEVAFRRKMEQIRRDEELKAEERKLALGKAKKEIELARKEAERAAREAIEAEMKEEVASAKEREVIAQIRNEAGVRTEEERRAEAQRTKGFRRLFSKVS